MPFVDMICLANSNKMRGRCVAGLRVDGAGWVRPVAPETNHGQLFLRHFQLHDRSEPRALDLISLNLVRPQPAAGQPENWVTGKEAVEIEGAALGARSPLPAPRGDRERSAAAGIDSDTSIGGGIRSINGITGSGPAGEFARLSEARAGSASTAPRAFRSGRQKYDLPVTDPAWAARIIRTLSDEEPASPGQMLGISNDLPVILTVSLGEPFNGYCYKLAAAIIEIPGF